MQLNRYYVVRFEDLKEDKQEEIINNVSSGLSQEERDRLLELVGSDPFDFDHVNSDVAYEYIRGLAERTAYEWEIPVVV